MIAAAWESAQVRAQRDDEQQSAHGAGQPFDAGAEQVLDAVRHGDLLADRGQAVFGERASDLEREQGIPERRLVDAAQELPREAQPEPLGQDPPRGAEAERADLEPSQRPPLERALESSLDTGALGEQEADGLALEAAHGEVECVGGRRIEPLDVVDRDQQRLTGSQGAQRVQEAERDRVGLGRRARRLGPQKGHLQRAQLRSRQADELLRLDPVEQVDQRRQTRAARRRRSPAPRARAMPCTRASSIPASQSVVLPIPGSPVSTNAPGGPSRATKRCEPSELRVATDAARSSGRSPPSAFLL